MNWLNILELSEVIDDNRIIFDIMYKMGKDHVHCIQMQREPKVTYKFTSFSTLAFIYLFCFIN